MLLKGFSSGGFCSADKKCEPLIRSFVSHVFFENVQVGLPFFE